VESAVRDAADLGYFVTVVNDACAAESADAEAKGFKGMSGFGRMLSTEKIMQELEYSLVYHRAGECQASIDFPYLDTFYFFTFTPTALSCKLVMQYSSTVL
jgi:hypothetical protein